jgi:hypothetical protein
LANARLDSFFGANFFETKPRKAAAGQIESKKHTSLKLFDSVRGFSRRYSKRELIARLSETLRKPHKQGARTLSDLYGAFDSKGVSERDHRRYRERQKVPKEIGVESVKRQVFVVALLLAFTFHIRSKVLKKMNVKRMLGAILTILGMGDLMYAASAFNTSYGQNTRPLMTFCVVGLLFFGAGINLIRVTRGETIYGL